MSDCRFRAQASRVYFVVLSTIHASLARQSLLSISGREEASITKPLIKSIVYPIQGSNLGLCQGACGHERLVSVLCTELTGYHRTSDVNTSAENGAKQSAEDKVIKPLKGLLAGLRLHIFQM